MTFKVSEFEGGIGRGGDDRCEGEGRNKGDTFKKRPMVCTARYVQEKKMLKLQERRGGRKGEAEDRKRRKRMNGKVY